MKKVKPYTIEARNKLFLDAVKRKDRFFLGYMSTLKDVKQIVNIRTRSEALRYGLETNNPSDLIIITNTAQQFIGKILVDNARKGVETGYLFNINYKGFTELYNKMDLDNEY